jgi:hypothetical protein
MPDKERISRPSSGSNELGTETQEERITGGLSAGTDTQLELTALSGQKHKGHKKGNDKASSKNATNKKKP